MRPGTLLAAISPVLVGTALSISSSGAVHIVAVVLVLGAALSMQVVTNLQNDVGYTLRHGEVTGSRTGLPRATAQGWLSVRQVRAGIVFTVILAIGLGVVLVAYRGWPVLLIGAGSLLAALAYMGGPKPIAYTAFGELTVFLFFGLVAVMGTEWVLVGSVGLSGLLASISIGGLAAAALAVNNHRDIEHDRSVGRRTFAVVAGKAGSHRLYAALLLGSFVPVPVMAVCFHAPWLVLPLLLAPAAIRLRHDFARCRPGAAFNEILFRTFRLELWFALLLCAGLLLAGKLA